MEKSLTDLLMQKPNKLPHGNVEYITKGLDYWHDSIAIYYDAEHDYLTDDGNYIEFLFSFYGADKEGTNKEKMRRLFRNIAQNYFCDVNENEELICKDDENNCGDELVLMIQAITALSSLASTSDIWQTTIEQLEKEK